MDFIITLTLIIAVFAISYFLLTDNTRTSWEIRNILKNTGFDRIG